MRTGIGGGVSGEAASHATAIATSIVAGVHHPRRVAVVAAKARDKHVVRTTAGSLVHEVARVRAHVRALAAPAGAGAVGVSGEVDEDGGVWLSIGLESTNRAAVAAAAAELVAFLRGWRGAAATSGAAAAADVDVGTPSAVHVAYVDAPSGAAAGATAAAVDGVDTEAAAGAGKATAATSEAVGAAASAAAGAAAGGVDSPAPPCTALVATYAAWVQWVADRSPIGAPAGGSLR